MSPVCSGYNDGSKIIAARRAVEWPKTPEKPTGSTACPTRKGTPITWCGSPCRNSPSICPVTGQPDFAHLVIDYVPGQWLLESKFPEALCRQFPQSWRVSRGLPVSIGRESQPKSNRNGCASALLVSARGIPIDVFWQTGRLPKGMWIPDQGVAPYRGRG